MNWRSLESFLARDGKRGTKLVQAARAVGLAPNPRKYEQLHATSRCAVEANCLLAAAAIELPTAISELITTSNASQENGDRSIGVRVCVTTEVWRLPRRCPVHTCRLRRRR
jgi:hypothetical protein